MKNIIRKTVVFALATIALSIPARAAEHHGHGSGSLLENYVAIQKALAADSTAHVAHRAGAIEKLAAAHKVHGLPHEAAAQAKKLAAAKDLKAMREAFKPLSKTVAGYLAKHPDKSGKYRTAHCMMAKADWVQTGTEIANPYYGKSMLRCGSFKP